MGSDGDGPVQGTSQSVPESGDLHELPTYPSFMTGDIYLSFPDHTV